MISLAINNCSLSSIRWVSFNVNSKSFSAGTGDQGVADLKISNRSRYARYGKLILNIQTLTCRRCLAGKIKELVRFLIAYLSNFQWFPVEYLWREIHHYDTLHNSCERAGSRDSRCDLNEKIAVQLTGLVYLGSPGPVTMINDPEQKTTAFPHLRLIYSSIVLANVNWRG